MHVGLTSLSGKFNSLSDDGGGDGGTRLTVRCGVHSRTGRRGDGGGGVIDGRDCWNSWNCRLPLKKGGCAAVPLLRRIASINETLA